MITLDALKDWLGITVDTYDDSLTAAIARATDFVEHELDWYFREPRETTEVLSGRGTSAIYLRQPPAGEVVVSSRTRVGGQWEAVDSELYEVDGRGVYHQTAWWPGVRNYRVVYEEGFVETPGDVQQVVLDLVAGWWRSKDLAGLQSESIGDYAYTRADLDEYASTWPQVRASWQRLRA